MRYKLLTNSENIVYGKVIFEILHPIMMLLGGIGTRGVNLGELHVQTRFT